MRQTLAAIIFGVLLCPPLSAGAAEHHSQYAMLSAPRAARHVVKADRIVVLKGERQLVLMRGDRVLRVFPVALGRYPKGPKTRKGDARTPEGRYTIDYRLGRGKSNFYKALHISYPNAHDLARANRLGVDPGGQIMIHGLPEHWTAKQLDHPYLDWTQGCIAVTDRQMDEIWKMVSDGTEIDIEP